MDTEVTAMYCITDDWLKARRHQESLQCEVTDAEVMTVALAAARFFEGNFEKAWRHLTEGRYMLRRLSRGQFNRRLHRISHLFQELFERLAQHWKQASEEGVYLIDSFPIPVCDNIRIDQCQIYPISATKEAFRGYTASKRRFFYGLKMHVLTNAEGQPVEAFLTPGSRSDTGQLRHFEFDLPEGSTVYCDKAYNEYFTEDTLTDACKINLSPIRKKNSTRPDSASVRYLQAVYRKRIETTFSQIDRLMPESIHAITAKGFELKVFLFVLAFSFDGLF